jgi:putative DNA primase/helicase
MNENKKVLAALHYHTLGLSIIPVGANKKPLVEWKQYQNSSATIIEINKWWQQFPDANPAIVTGKISGIVVLDLDKKHSRTSKEFSLPVTACAISGNGGEHFFFKYPNRPVGNGTAIDGEGVDFRGDGGYVLLDPSMNETGGTYQWNVPIEDGLADMPEWLLKKMIPEEGSDKKWLSGKDGVSEGQRNDTAASMAGKIVSSTAPELLESLGWEQLKVWNNKNTPPLDEKELRSVFDSIAQKHTDLKSKKTLRNNMNGIAVTACLADIQPEAIKWLWEGRIALGKLTMIAGDPGLGKSLLTATLATYVSKGYPFPVDGSCPPTGEVVLLSAEDDPADTIRPRLDAAGADCTRIHILKTIQTIDSNGMPTQRTFSFKRDVAVLKELLVSLPNCCLVVIDPVSAYLDGADSNNNSDIRGLFAPLADLAAQHKIAIVLVSHLNKNSGGNALYRTMGSLAFTAAVRAAYIVTKDQHNPERRLLMPAKNNLAKDSTGLAYSVITAENGAPVIVWESEAVTITADEALALPESSEQHTATDDAIDFLADFLSNGSAKASDIQKEARTLGISAKCLNRARTKLGIQSKKFDFAGGWVWSLSEDSLGSEDAPLKIAGILGEAGHLGDEQEILM